MEVCQGAWRRLCPCQAQVSSAGRRRRWGGAQFAAVQPWMLLLLLLAGSRPCFCAYADGNPVSILVCAARNWLVRERANARQAGWRRRRRHGRHPHEWAGAGAAPAWSPLLHFMIIHLVLFNCGMSGQPCTVNERGCWLKGQTGTKATGHPPQRMAQVHMPSQHHAWQPVQAASPHIASSHNGATLSWGCQGEPCHCTVFFYSCAVCTTRLAAFWRGEQPCCPKQELQL